VISFVRAEGLDIEADQEVLARTRHRYNDFQHLVQFDAAAAVKHYRT
jgi:hypothetical protein